MRCLQQQNMRNNKKSVWVFLWRRAMVLMNSQQTFEIAILGNTPRKELKLLYSNYIMGRKGERVAYKSLNPPQEIV